MDELTVFPLSIVLVCLSFYIFVSQMYSKSKQIRDAKRVLLVTAHPDDETMFFGPTVLNFTESRASANLFLLCMSNGNFRKNGHVRKNELYKAARLLKIKEENITLLNYTRLPDNQAVRWKEEIVAEKILQMVSAYDIDTVLTFDRNGISGHANHTSLYYSAVFLMLEDKLPKDVSVFVLQSVNIVRKYSSFLDAPLSFLLGTVVYVAKPSHWLTLFYAMNEHYSQFVWYRKLYVLFSRYMLINTYERLRLNMTVRTPGTQETPVPRKLRGPRRQFYITPVKAE